MAVFADYLDLRFAVTDLVGNRSISDVMPRLVQMAETKLNQKLRCRQQITDATLTFTDGVAPLPTGFLEMLHVFDHSGHPMRATDIARTVSSRAQNSRYAINGSSVLIDGYSGDRDCRYFTALPTLTSSSSASNWLLEDAPDVYLYAVGVEAAKHLRDAELAMTTGALLEQAMDALKVDDDRARWANATVFVQGNTP
ncbi:hypothetical protein JYP46_01505 [Nitratireductor aquimarinus]|uniref:phage adaptor protein n=1 Tax=Alphaproteobacteria TaxID=28211 RepID=UPI0019D3BD4E|nr:MULTISPECIES: hypothetical protein [Alphaproteobacteria]MBN7755487.1 hypothetical protein [Nitratireductor aquimarinus]MBY5998242.1 hypothetical protein [Tritonibacter mobilis]MBY6020270.1 hypothetical protein [Nitratireductor sp. DP7N14-4]